ADGSVLAGGKNPSPEVYTVTATTKATGITGLRLEVLPDDSLPAKGPGRSPTNGNFVLNEFKVTVAPENDPKAAKAVVFKRALAEFGPPPDKRLLGAQDVAWALINSPAFLFNH